MEATFTSLTKRQTMLLLSAVSLGGQQVVETLDALAEPEAALLKHRAQLLLQIPREKRIPLVVSEMKRLVGSKKGLFWSVDPEKLADVLRNERPVLVDVLLRALPVNLATAIRLHLPPRRVLGRKEIKPEVLNVVRWKLDEILRRQIPQKVKLKFSDLKLLEVRELLTVCHHLGVRALGPILAGLPEPDRQQVLAGLPPELQVPAAQAAQAAQARKLLPEDAAELLALHRQEGAALGAVESIGAQRLVRGAMAQSEEFATSLLEKHLALLPAAFARWFKEERGRTIDRGDGGRIEVVVEMEHLAERGLLEPPLRMPPASKPPLAPPRLGPPQPAPKPAPPVPTPGLPAELPRFSRPALPPPRRPAPADPGSPPKTGIRDPIAERLARRAGAAGGAQDAPTSVERPAATPSKVQRAPLTEQRPTLTQRKTSPSRPGRGPKGGSR